MTSFKTLLLLLICLSLSLPLPIPGLGSHALAVDKPYYDEVYKTSKKGKKKVRRRYRKIMLVYSRLGKKDRQKFRIKSIKAFDGDNALRPLPRVFTAKEGLTIAMGLRQRALALNLFLHDYYRGGRRWQTVIPEVVLNSILARHGELDFRDQIVPEDIAFPYGPDIIRTADGNFRVIEDNTGFIGGYGDLFLAREELFRNFPEYQKILKDTLTPEDFYKRLLQRFEKSKTKGIKVFLSIPPYADNEDNRLIDIYRRNGYEIITPKSKAKLIFEKDRVLLQKKVNGKTIRKKVGFIFLNTEQVTADPGDAMIKKAWLIHEAKFFLSDGGVNKEHRRALKNILRKVPIDFVKLRAELASADDLDMPPKTDKKSLIDEAELRIQDTGITRKERRMLEAALTLRDGREIDYAKIEEILRDKLSYEYSLPDDLKNSFPGLTNAILKRHVGTNSYPGLEFINDKEFYTYVEELIRLYLGEDPILKNIETIRLYDIDAEGKVQPNLEKIERVFSEFDKWVVKVVDGRGGDDVYVGPKIASAEHDAIKKRVLRGRKFIAQPFNHLSVHGKDIVDSRFFAQVGPSREFAENRLVEVLPGAWGRGQPLNKGDGKVNLSKTGHEVTIFIRSCAELLEKE